MGVSGGRVLLLLIATTIVVGDGGCDVAAGVSGLYKLNCPME